LPSEETLASRGNVPALPQLGRDAVKIGIPDSPRQSISPFGGRSLVNTRKTGEWPMNIMSKVDIDSTETAEVDNDLAAVSEVEAGIRDFVRNDVAYLRRPMSASTSEPTLDPNAEATVNNVNSLIQRVAGTSLSEIENLISELEALRELLHAEGQRVQREISGYAQLSQAAMKSTRMISDNVQQWKRTADGLRNG
jgi:hypothetical protein